MINKELINIRNFIKIIIGILVIFSMFKSCAKANSITPSQSLMDEINTNIVRVANYYNINYYPVYTSQNIMQADGINTYCIYITESNSGWKPNTIGAFFPTTAKLKPTYNGSSVLNNVNSTAININNGSSSYIGDWSVGKNAKFAYLYTQFDWETSTGFNYQANNEYGAEIIFAPLVNISFGHMFSTTITYNNEEMQANTLDYNHRIEFIENVVTEDNEITSMQATLGTLNLECQDLGSYWTLKYNNSTQLQYNQVYDLIITAIVNGNEEEIEEKVIFVPPGTTISGGVITSIPSGDYGFNTENATNQIIENQQQQQQENQNFFENLYNKMLTPSGEKINSMITTAMNDLNMPSRRDRTSNSGA